MTRDESLRATLRALGAQRADAYADHMRPDGARETTMTTQNEETWRVVEPYGAVSVLRVQSIGDGVYIVDCDTMGREHVRGETLRAAVEHFASQWLNIAEIRGPGEATTAEQLAAALSGVVDIADGVELAAHASRERALATEGWQLVDLAHHEGAAMAACRIARAVRDLLAGQGESAGAYAAPMREQLAAETARADAAEQECARLRAIVDGRTTPPTDAEIAAHEAAGGKWRARTPLGGGVADTDMMSEGSALRWASVCRERGIAATWWALDAAGRPCAWPVVDGVTR